MTRLFLILLAVFAALPAAADEPDRSFLVFDALSFRDKPPSEALGMRRLNVIYDGSFWGQGEPRDEPRYNPVVVRARQAARIGDLVCIDIEHWPVGPEADPAVVAESIRKYATVADWMHEAEPGLRLGYYGVLPIRDYWSLFGDNEAERESWEAANARLEALSPHVDVVFPSLYTFYNDPEGWKRYAIANIEQAKRYQKQVYPFLWFEFHDSNEALQGRQVPREFWRMQLELCREYADGVVIWGGWDTQAKANRAWDDEALWWQETQAFLESLK